MRRCSPGGQQEKAFHREQHPQRHGSSSRLWPSEPAWSFYNTSRRIKACGWFSRAKKNLGPSPRSTLAVTGQDPLQLELFHQLLLCFRWIQISLRSPFLLWVSSLVWTLLPGMSEAHTSSSWQARRAPYKTVVTMFAFAFITYLSPTAEYHTSPSSFFSRITRGASQGDSGEQVYWISKRLVPFLAVAFWMH